MIKEPKGYKDEEEFALTMCKKKRKIRKKDFLVYAEEIGIRKITAEKLLVEVIKEKETLIAMCEDSYLAEDTKSRLKNIILARINVLSE